MRIAMLAACVVAALALAAAPATAETITFDEFAADNVNGPMPANRYAAKGVTFVATDDGTTWGGIDNGDPGNWDLNGTNGAIFSGFNGDSDGLTMLFASVVNGFSMDASRSAGSSAGDTLTLTGWLNNVQVSSETITFGNINSWSTLTIGTAVDEIRFVGNGQGFNPFGVDNVNWNPVPEPGTLALLGLGLFGVAVHRRRKKSL